MIEKILGSEICKIDRGLGMVALQALQVSCLSDMHIYESSKLKKWMCELLTFLQKIQ